MILRGRETGLSELGNQRVSYMANLCVCKALVRRKFRLFISQGDHQETVTGLLLCGSNKTGHGGSWIAAKESLLL